MSQPFFDLASRPAADVGQSFDLSAPFPDLRARVSATLSQPTDADTAHLDRRIQAIQVFREHLLPHLVRQEDPQTQQPPELQLVLQSAQILISRALEESKRSRCRGEIAEEEGYLDISRRLVRECGNVVRICTEHAECAKSWTSVPDFIPQLLSTVFTFCHECSSECGTAADFRERKILLKDFYGDCKLLLETYRNFIENVMVFDEDDSDTSAVLIRSVEVVQQMLAFLSDLDLDGFGKAAKIFLKQSQSHRSFLRVHLKVENTFRQICQLGLNYCEKTEKAFRERGSVIAEKTWASKLRVVIKLLKNIHDQFCGMLGTNFQEVSSLVLRVLRFNEGGVLHQETKQQLTVLCARHLMDQLMIDQNFCNFVLSGKLQGSDQYGLCQLYGSLLSRLPAIENEGTRRGWMKSQDENLLLLVLEISGHCPEFNLKPFVVGVEHSGRGQVQVTAYENIVTLIQTFVVGANAREMEIVEVCLLRTVVKSSTDDFWAKKLASDVWCFIGRFGPSSYCFEHTKVLATILYKRRHPHVARLLERLSSFLHELDVRTLQANYDPSQTDLNLALWASLSLSSCDRQFKQVLNSRSLTLLKKFVVGEITTLDHACSATTLLEKLWEELSVDCKAEVRELISVIWTKLHLGHYPVNKSGWSVRLFRSIMCLTCRAIKDADANRTLDIIGHVKGVLDNSAGEEFFCYLVADFLPSAVCLDNASVRDLVGRTWISLFVAATSCALLELKVTSSFMSSQHATLLNNDSFPLSRDWKDKVSRFKEDDSSVLDKDPSWYLRSLNITVEDQVQDPVNEDFRNLISVLEKAAREAGALKPSEVELKVLAGNVVRELDSIRDRLLCEQIASNK